MEAVELFGSNDTVEAHWAVTEKKGINKMEGKKNPEEKAVDSNVLLFFENMNNVLWREYWFKTGSAH